MKIAIFILLLFFIQSAFSEDKIEEINEHYFCSLVMYSHLKSKLDAIDKVDEIQLLDQIGVLWGKAHNLSMKISKEKKNIKMLRKKAIQEFNKRIKHIRTLNTQDQTKESNEIGLRCSELYVRAYYTEDEIKQSGKEWKELLKSN